MSATTGKCDVTVEVDRRVDPSLRARSCLPHARRAYYVCNIGDDGGGISKGGARGRKWGESVRRGILGGVRLNNSRERGVLGMPAARREMVPDLSVTLIATCRAQLNSAHAATGIGAGFWTNLCIRSVCAPVARTSD